MRARFGTAGNPDGFYQAGKKQSKDMPPWLREQGLEAYEYQCGKGVTVGEATARAIGQAAAEAGIALSLHAPYFVNPANPDPDSQEKTLGHVLKACQAAQWMGADRVVVHTGALQKRTREEALATAKACAVAEENPDDVVCGFDTVVECEGEVFGKPKDEADAVRMLRALSGREHRVHTGVCICRGRRAAATVETTVVHFSPIAEDDLCAYVRTPEPYDKAGAYAIQGHAALWCAGIEGCYYNIMGLPVHRTAQLLREFT